MILLPSFVPAQKVFVNELVTMHNVYKRISGSDTTAINQLIKIGKWHLKASQLIKYSNSTDSVVYYADKVQRLSSSVKYPIGEARSYLLRGRLALQNGDYGKVRYFASQAEALFDKAKDKYGKVEALTLSVTAYGEKATPESLGIAYKVLNVYIRNGDKLKQGYILRIIGLMQLSRTEYKESLESIKKSLKILEENKLSNEELAQSLVHASSASYFMGNIQEALEYSLKALNLSEKIDSQSYVTGLAYNGLARIYHTTGDYPKALIHYKKSVEILEKYKADDFSTSAIGNTAQILLDMGRKQESLFYLKKLQNRITLNAVARSTVILRSIKIYTALGDYEQAEKYVLRAKKIINDKPFALTTNNLYTPVANYYFKVGQYEKARDYLEKYKMVAKKNQSKITFLQIYKQLYQIDSAQSAFIPAIRNLKLAYAYRDSMFGESNRNKMSDLQVKYDVLKKDRDLLLKEEKNKKLIREAEVQKLLISRSKIIRNFSVAGIFILAVIIGLIYSRYRTNRKMNSILQSQKATIEANNITLTQNVAEKEWLLKEIHHRVKNNLQIVMSLLNSQSYFLSDKLSLEVIQKSQHRIQSMSLIHQKLYMSDNLSEIRMPEYISELVDYLKDSFAVPRIIKLTLKVDNVFMDVSQAVPIGLILNESITNSLKYAFSDAGGIIEIVLQNIDGDIFLLEITDDGCGLPEDFTIDNSRSLGMRLIKGLAADLGGNLTINREKGTQIKIEFSYKRLRYKS
ncbi:hypothetical protein A1704_06275 [Chryseobacterium cucumeris]|nr:tetratricopeptide repeat protein [Chryseobacterium wanjuense]KYH08257.1 hypothetical protein A1704_06275 [Chryseobacterium cucumeris]